MPSDKSSAPGAPESAPSGPDSPDPAAAGSARFPGTAPRTVDAQAMKAFAHPLRMAIYSHLTDVGAATATALARHLGESTGQTSYHLRQLEKHGFVAEDPGRGTGRERWWKPLGFAVPTFDLAQDEANRPAIEAMMRNRLHERADALARWLSVETTEDREWIEASVDNTTTRSLTAAQARALTEELMAVVARHLGPADVAPGAQPVDEDAAEGTAETDVEESAEHAGGGEEPATDAPSGEEPTRRVRLYLSVFPLPAGEAPGAPEGPAAVGTPHRAPAPEGAATGTQAPADVAESPADPAPGRDTTG
ncbi:ArsR family transcriptional regulator [Citricoccus sp. SGAir0253]|uniref:winged helix-turn-helix domain-containing protein n=1 Tax=Citricoccus sp. SGAir0253 TaxID=2567881 RepID=UPI0010CD6B6E|nr:helix-turn-helix domain-containing protein [Citricoccus sp. SGAir0253]QCU77200.1 ArsR family transcriptional regulator [Citricoccus sp. SGAir0253]